MAAIGAGNPTLLDQIKRTEPGGAIAAIAEVLEERNPVLKDATVLPGNRDTGHEVTIRDGLPEVGWRRLNEGIDASKSTTIQVQETCGLLEARSEVDCEVARINGNEAAFRASEDRAFIQSMNIEAMSALFYASTKTAPEKMHGFTPRFDDLGGGNVDNIVDFAAVSGDAADGADQASIWFITWHPETCFMTYPRGMVGGLQYEDMGKQYVLDANSKKFRAWCSNWDWRLGLVIKDWRYIVRVGNIDAVNIDTATTELIECLVEAYHRIYDLNTGRTVIYCNRSILTALDLTVLTKANVWFGPMEWHGKPITAFRGIPIVPCDGLLSTESPMTAA